MSNPVYDIVGFCSPNVMKRALLLLDRVELWQPLTYSVLTTLPESLGEKIHSTNIANFPDHIISYMRFMNERVYLKQGQVLTPIFGQSEELPIYVPEGSSLAYSATIQNLPIAVEDALQWEQIEEFRADVEAATKYRKLRIWLASGLGTQTLSQAEDVIAQMIDDYTWAIKKHGLQTKIGMLRTLITSENITKLVLGTSVTAVIGGPIWATLFSGLVIGAEILTQIAERNIEGEDIKRGENSEIAILFDISKEVEKSGKTLVEKVFQRGQRDDEPKVSPEIRRKNTQMLLDALRQINNEEEKKDE